MNDIKVSILCTTYNHGKYVKQALDSFIHQKTNFNIEIIVHDDASTDNTREIITEFAEHFHETIIPILQEKNQLGRGVDIYTDFLFPAAQGEYLAICEGDDYWCDDNKLQRQVNFLEEHLDYSGTVHNAMMVDHNEKSLRPLSPDEDQDIVTMNEYMDFPHTSSYVFRNPLFNGDPAVREYFKKCIGRDKAIALFMLRTGIVRYFHNIMSCYRYVANTGDSDSARTKRANNTIEKVRLELYFIQLANEEYHLHLDLRPHYYRNVVDYALLWALKKPSWKNIRLLRYAVQQCPDKRHYISYVIDKLRIKIQHKASITNK